jgi:hypothetical protein
MQHMEIHPSLPCSPRHPTLKGIFARQKTENLLVALTSEGGKRVNIKVKNLIFRYL